MDPEDLPDFLDKILTTKESRVDILRLVPSEGVVTKVALDDDRLRNELANINTSVVKTITGNLASSTTWGPFVLL